MFLILRRPPYLSFKYTISFLLNVIVGIFCTEQAVSGHRREADPLLAGAADLKRDWSDNDAARTVSAEVTTPMYGDEAPMKTRKECTYRKEKPVKTVRRAHAVIELTEGD